MTGAPKRLPAFFYRSAAGVEPVRQWLKGFSAEDLHKLGYDISLVEFGWPVGMPYAGHLAPGCGKYALR